MKSLNFLLPFSGWINKPLIGEACFNPYFYTGIYQPDMNYYLFALQNYFQFEGRANRSEYWYFFLFNTLTSLILVFLSARTGSLLLYNIYAVAVLIPGLAVGIRRMHDVGQSGWMLLIPFYNLYLAISPSDPNHNEYGAPRNFEL